MFDERQYECKDSLDTAREKHKMKKILFNLSKAEFSDMNPFRLKYYACVNEHLHNTQLAGKDLDKAIVHCKYKLERIERYINETNQHAKIKVKRCTQSKREWARQFGRDLIIEEKGAWECLNRYHRRYMYYYPGIRDSTTLQ